MASLGFSFGIQYSSGFLDYRAALASMPESNLIEHRHVAPPVRRGRLCWIGFSTFLIRSYEDITTHFMFTIAPPAVTTALYCVVFGKLIGQHIGDVNGLTYAQYIAPGLILLPIIAGSYGQ